MNNQATKLEILSEEILDIISLGQERLSPLTSDMFLLLSGVKNVNLGFETDLLVFTDCKGHQFNDINVIKLS